MIFSKFIFSSIFTLFLCVILMNFYRNFMNAFRKWKTKWRSAEFVAKFCEIKFPKLNKILVFIFQHFCDLHDRHTFAPLKTKKDHKGSYFRKFRKLSDLNFCDSSRFLRILVKINSNQLKSKQIKSKQAINP